MQLKLELRDGKLRPVVLEGEDSPKRNSYVETLQNCLTAAGYDPGPIDGKFGKSKKNKPSKTEEAVKKFQKDNGLKETGRVDPETAKKLDEKVKDKIVEQTQEEEIKEYLDTGKEEKENKKEEDEKDEREQKKEKRRDRK